MDPKLLFWFMVLALVEVHCAITVKNFSDVSDYQIGSERKVQARTFEIDYENDRFLMDGQPFQYIAGSMHYFRCPHQYWRDRLRTMRAAGLNAVSTYVEWSFHEPEYRQYKWSEDRDLVKFIEIAQEEDLYVVLRPGPYICAERDMGGLPYWLLTKYPTIKLRTNDEDYKLEVQTWYAELMPKLEHLFYENGGPIITVQVENEYGGFDACDKVYMKWLSELTEMWVKGTAVLFTTDSVYDAHLTCGSAPGAYTTVDFGTGHDVAESWEVLRRFSPKGPLVNSEFYPGWYTRWGDKVTLISTSIIIKRMEDMLATNASFNFYMFYGGTNFGFTAGAYLSPMYASDITSYDYDAPMTEAGDPTPKYMEIRNIIAKYMPLPNIPVPEVKEKGSYGTVVLNPVLALLEPEGRQRLGTKTWTHESPETMEALEQYSGFLLYESTLPSRRPDPSVLTVPDLRDRATVYVNGSLVGVLSRTREVNSLPIMAVTGDELQILVENQGRVNYALAEDFKGIQGDVLFNSNRQTNWVSTNFPLETVESAIVDLTVEIKQKSTRDSVVEGILNNGPIIYSKTFVLPEGEVLDTYLDVTGWGKGIVWLNDINLGRYWPKEGPQVTLYVPGVYFNEYPKNNTLIILEIEYTPKNFSMTFVDTPNLGHNRKNI